MLETTCLIPLRSPGEGKTRLAPALDVDQRAALAGAMLADVAAAVRGADVERIVVAAAGPSAAAAASALGLEVVVDGPGVRGLDAAIAAAAARQEPVEALLVVQADLPQLTTGDVRAVLDGDDAVVVAPTSDGGTSALLRRPASIIDTAYGPDSGRAHQRAAEAAGITPRVVVRPGLAHDVDTYEDVRALDLDQVGPATRAVLQALPDRHRLGA